MKYIGLFFIAFSGVLAWLAWGPILHFFFSLIPPNADYAWIGKILITFLVAYFGGIALPLISLFVGIGFIINDK